MSRFAMRRDKKSASAATRSTDHSVRRKDRAVIPTQLRARLGALAYTHEMHPGGEARSTGVGRDYNASESSAGKRVAIIQRMRNNVVQRCGKKGSGSGLKESEIRDLARRYTLSDQTYICHILDRHGPSSKYKDKTRFEKNFDIKGGIDQTLKDSSSKVMPNTEDKKGHIRDGYIFEKTFVVSIGKETRTDGTVADLYTLKVVIDMSGNVITAFPKR